MVRNNSHVLISSGSMTNSSLVPNTRLEKESVTSPKKLKGTYQCAGARDPNVSLLVNSIFYRTQFSSKGIEIYKIK